MDLAVLRPAKHEVQHVEEMHADIGGNSPRLLLVAFPGIEIPFSARGDVGKVDFMLCRARTLRRDGLAEGDDRRVETQLEDRIDLPSRIRLGFDEPVDVPGIEYQRLLADRI